MGFIVSYDTLFGLQPSVHASRDANRTEDRFVRAQTQTPACGQLLYHRTHAAGREDFVESDPLPTN